MKPWAWCIFLFAILLRCLGLFRPMVGNFGDYQASMGMVARFFVENHFTTLLYPETNVLVNGQPSLLLLFYPLCSALAAVPTFLFGWGPDFWGRLQAVIFFALSCLTLYRLVLLLNIGKLALGAVIAFTLSPLTIIYGQSFLNEMGTTFFSILFLYGFVRFLKDSSPTACVTSCVAFAAVLLARPNGLYLILPALWLVFDKNKDLRWKGSPLLKLLLVLCTGLVLPTLWYLHVWSVSRSAANVYMTVFPQLMSRASFLSPLVLSPGYYKALWDTLSGIVLTPIGAAFFIVGTLLATQDKGLRVFLVWGLGFVLSTLVIPRKLIDHNFYWLPFVAAASPLIAGGFSKITDRWSGGEKSLRWFTMGFLTLTLLVAMRYALHPAFKTPAHEGHVMSVSRKIAELTQKGASKLIVQGSRAFLYYSNRYGWHAFPLKVDRRDLHYHDLANWQHLPPENWLRRNRAIENPIEYLEYMRESEGATHFVVTNPESFYAAAEFANYLHKNYELLYEDKGTCLIFKLAKG